MEKQYPVIAGREKGPGPGRYGLPPTIGFIGHDFTKPSSPAYSFHARMSDNSEHFYISFTIFETSAKPVVKSSREPLEGDDASQFCFSPLYSVDSSPGPQYHVDAKISRFGKDGTPAYSILGRMKAQKKLFHTPGPGAYSPEKAPPCNLQRRPPSYTMGSRTYYRSMDSVPAPNKYCLPPVLGSRVPNKPASASYTISSIYDTGGPSVDLAKTPGPCRYNSTDPSVYLPRQPAFSMLGRHSLPRNATTTPGPGNYSPEKVTAHRARAPAYSLGIRHSEFVTPLIVNVSD